MHLQGRKVSCPTHEGEQLCLLRFKYGSVWLQGKNVLRKEPMGKDINDTDVFRINEDFRSKLYKIKIGTVSASRESEPENLETRHKVRWAA